MDILANARQDFLTKCYTKEHLIPYLSSLIEENKASQKPFSVLVLDLDRFKKFNDKHGHLQGDDVLENFSSALRLSFKEEGAIFRFGGDEFVAIFPGKSAHDINHVAVRLHKNMKKRPFLIGDRLFKISFSGGIVSYPADSTAPAAIIECADKAMYAAKKHGRARTLLYRNLRFDGIKRFVAHLAIIVVAGITLFSVADSYKAYLEEAVSYVESARAFFTPIEKHKLVTIYLKSGEIYKGAVIRKGKTWFIFQLVLPHGRGFIAVHKSNIEKITGFSIT